MELYAKIISLDVEEYGEIVDGDIISLYFYPDENKFYTSEGYPILVPWRYIPFWVYDLFLSSDIGYLCVETTNNEVVEVFYPRQDEDIEAWFGIERS